MRLIDYRIVVSSLTRNVTVSNVPRIGVLYAEALEARCAGAPYYSVIAASYEITTKSSCDVSNTHNDHYRNYNFTLC